jgi:hypothetical protein
MYRERGIITYFAQLKQRQQRHIMCDITEKISNAQTPNLHFSS